MSSKGNFIKNLKIGKKLLLLLMVFIICFIFVGSFSFYTINSIKINGSLYQDIISGKDLVADILPPPAFIVEAYTAVLEISNTDDRVLISSRVNKLKGLKQNYEQRHEYWEKKIKEADVRKIMLTDSYEPAVEFFKVTEEEYIPAILAGDRTKAQQLLTGKLQPLFAKHKDAIDKITTLVNEDNANLEKKAAAKIRLSILVLSAVIAAGLTFVIVIGLYISSCISRPVKNLKNVADKLAMGEVDIDLYADSKDEIGDLMGSFSKMIDSTRKQAEAGERIANGDLSVEIIPRSEKDILAVSMKSVIENLRALANETHSLTTAAMEGDLNYRGDSQRFQGGFREIVEGINSTLDGIVDPLNVALAYIQRIADGDELEELENNYRGQYHSLISNLLEVRKSLNLLSSESDRLTMAAFNGEFSYQPDISLHKGGYAKIMKSVNDALDYIIAPLRRAGDYMRKIGNGEIPEKIADEYSGEFKDIISSINDCIDGLGGLIEGRSILERMSVNDYTCQVKGSYLGIYSEIADSINSVSDRVRNTIRIVNNISKGDLSDLHDLKEIGRRSENDTLMPSVIILIENIQALIDEAEFLTTAVIEGRLDTKADTEQFQGAWKNLVDGMYRIMVEVAKPLMDVSEVMEGIAQGKLSVAVQGSYQGDFDKLKQSVNTTSSLLNTLVGEMKEIIGQIAEGNLSLERVRDYHGDFSEISDSLNIIIDSLNLVLGDISGAAEQVSAGSRQVSDGSQSLSQGSTEQASSIEELTSSISDITLKTRENAMNASQASELAAAAKNNAVNGNQQMQEMLKSMEEINDSSSNISKIIKVIDDISFQTNILALNAAVEAARAGQYGKGFAVVAEEVRNLAARCAEAARDTTGLIEGSMGKVQTGIKIANETAAALAEIVSGIDQSASLVENIAALSNEQASGIAQISRGLEQVSQVVQNNSATAEESAAASQEMTAQALTLKSMIQRFKLRENQENIYSHLLEAPQADEMPENKLPAVFPGADKY